MSVVPSGRYLTAFGMIAVPALTFAAAGFWVAASYGLLTLFAVLSAADAFMGWRSFAGLSVAGPPLIRMWKDREGIIDVTFVNDRRRARRVRVALVLPEAIEARPEIKEVLLPAGADHSHTEWKCMPLKRGRYAVTSCVVDCGSPLRLWRLRNLLPLTTEIRVYPTVASEQKTAPDLFIRKLQAGVHMHRQVGKGREFEKLREYVPGDGFDDIDWKATARRGHPITRVFQVERTQEVYVVLDSSRLTARAAAESGPSILERNITASLLLALASEKRGDLFGLVTFSDRVRGFVRARSGKVHYGACREALYTLEPRIVSPDFDEVSTMLRLKLRRRALIIFLTELDDPALADAFLRNVTLLRRQHLIVVGMARPEGARPLFETPADESAGAVYRQLAGHILWRRLRELGKVLERQGVHFTLLEPGRAGVQLASMYADIKQRQLL